MLFFLLVLLAGLANADDSLCPTGWYFSTNTSLCYTVSKQSMTWDDSINYCKGIGGSLVIFSTTREVTYLSALTAVNTVQPWMAYRRNSNGNFYDVDGYSVSSVLWGQNEPSTNGDCVTFRGQSPSGLRATPCYNIQPAICKQMPALCPTQTQYGGLTTRSGNISSPGYPVQYYNNLRCPYYITSPPGTYITLNFDIWMVEYYYDYMFVFDGPTFTSPYLGEPSTGYFGKNSFESSNNSMTLYFYTDSIITDRGWSATWSAKANTPPIRQSGQNGSFTSDNYPNNYDSYAERVYYISTVSGFNINLTITDFETELNFDVLRVYAGSTVSDSTLIANLSGSSVAPWNYVSPANYVTLKFTSDATIEKKGWSLFWFMQ